jgi:hypothetical protein
MFNQANRTLDTSNTLSAGTTISGMFSGDYTSGTTYNTGTTITGGLTLNNNITITNMNQQVKVAVFRVERNKHNGIKSSTFVDEYWIEKKPGVSIDYAVALELQSRGLGKTKADEIVIKEIYTVTL